MYFRLKTNIALFFLLLALAKSATCYEAQDLVKDIGSRGNLNDDKEARSILNQVEGLKKSQKFIKEDLKKAHDLSNKVKKLRNSSSFKSHSSWVNQNKEKLFLRQGESLPHIDFMPRNQGKIDEKNSLVNLLKNYRFKPESIKRGKIIHHCLMIFASSSLPKNSLKSLIYQARKAGGILVFKGMINGSIKETAKFLENLNKENVSAIIDPRLFDQFAIKQVPTFIILADNASICNKAGCNNTPIHDRIEGNISLKYALEEVIAKGDAIRMAKMHLDKLEGGNL